MPASREYTKHAHQKTNTPEKERSHTAIGYGRKGVSHGRRTSPLSQIFLLLAMMTLLPATIMAWPDPYFLPRGPVVSCICFVEIEQPDLADPRLSGETGGGKGPRRFSEKV